MSEQGAAVAANIDRILESIGSGVPAVGSAVTGVEDLVASIEQYLTLPVPRDLRASAEKVAGFDSASVDAEVFSQALLALRRALKDQFAQEEAAAQLADDPEMLQEFLVESRAHLAGVESGLLRLEGQPDDAEAINAVFRSFHTVKGLAGFLGAGAIQELAHETENVLDEARSGRLTPDPAVVDLILRATDELGRCLDVAAEQGVRNMPRCNPALLAALAALADPGTARDAEAAVPLSASSAVCHPVVSAAIAQARPRAGRSSAEVSVVRVETAKLEYLIDMVGELVIAESVIRHNPRIKNSEDPLLSRNFAQLGRVVQEVQKTSMSMRMVAVGNLFRKMTRLVRDLARKSGKTVEMVTVGDDVELDRSIVEDLADPMIHMMRNAVDHGLEAPAARIAAGKSESGTVLLKAAHDAGEIVIEISDDGRGLDPAKILARARSQGIVGAEALPDEESIFKLIFEPGFSTADKVTDMSGRGVGMDVVRKQIQKLRGRIAIRSALGKGCTFTLRLPLTLAIIDGLVVGVGAQRFILPLFSVREMFAPEANTFVTLENRAEAVHFRDRLYPLIRLSRLLGGDQQLESPDAAVSNLLSDGSSGTLIIVESRDCLLCLAVDQLIGKQEVVIKSLGPAFRDVPAVAGGAILGDGRVGLIIDVNSLRHGRSA